jgi:hypothetical protein
VLRHGIIDDISDKIITRVQYTSTICKRTQNSQGSTIFLLDQKGYSKTKQKHEYSLRERAVAQVASGGWRECGRSGSIPVIEFWVFSLTKDLFPNSFNV